MSPANCFLYINATLGLQHFLLPRGFLKYVLLFFYRKFFPFTGPLYLVYQAEFQQEREDTVKGVIRETLMKRTFVGRC